MDWLYFITVLAQMIQNDKINVEDEVTPEDIGTVYNMAKVQWVIENFQRELEEGYEN